MVTDDPILVRWGLHNLLDGLSSPGTGSTAIQNTQIAQTEFFELAESHPVRGYGNFENDEVIAHALQEELSHLAEKEAAEGSQRTKEDPTQASVLAQDWLGASWREFETGEMAHDLDYGSNPNYNNDTGEDTENDEDDSSDLAEEFSTLDGEVGKRLTHMDSIPHVPRINGEIPTVDDATADHQRLLDRLRLYGLSELKIDGDGNCQFRAFSDQLYRTSEHHKSVREGVVNQLKSHPDLYEEYVPMKYSDYLKKMAKSGEWGDHVTLQAATDFYGVKVYLLTSFKDTCFVEILPRQPKSNRVIYLSFWAEVHYNSIYPQGDAELVALLLGQKKKKRRHWRDFLKIKLKL